MSTVSELLSLLDKIPAWKKISESPAKIEALEKRLAALEEKLTGAGDKCPNCGQYEFAMISSCPHPTFGELGSIERTYKCKECGFSEKKLIE